ncbi:monocarboxylate transporter 13-like [Anneissia japonica]|uniref:monocarboxylate transporter 13-like n=1 Tax=Anneissia japonica TaxID=1529436 RepID=UPI0014259D3B|nr:monocarboxylate transporter 13-like [Anneissia japonica]
MVTTYKSNLTKESMEKAMMANSVCDYERVCSFEDNETMKKMIKPNAIVQKITIIHRISEKSKLLLSKYWNCLCVLAAAMLFVPIAGLVMNYNLISLCFKDEFQSDSIVTGWIGSAAISLIVLSSPLSASLFDRFGFRPVIIAGLVFCAVGCIATSFVTKSAFLFISYSILLGVGANMVQFTSYNFCLNIYRNGKCAMATGTVSMGSALGMAVFPTIIETLIEILGWRGAFRVMGGIIFVNGLVCCIFLSSPSQTFETEDDTEVIEKKINPVKEISVPIRRESFAQKSVSMMKNLNSWLVSIAFLFLGIAIVFFYIDLIGFIRSVGFDDDDGALFLTVMGGTELGGRLLCTLLGDHLPLSVSSTYGLASLLGAVPPVVLPFMANNFAGVLMCIIVLSLARSVINTLWYPLCVEFFPMSQVTVGGTFMSVSFGIGNLLGSVVGGMLVDATGTYSATFYLCGGLHVVVTILLMIVRHRTRISKLRLSEKQHNVNYLGSIISLPAVYQPQTCTEVYVIENIITTV